MRAGAIALLSACALWTSGCAFGRRHAYHLANPRINHRGELAIALTVQDQRDSVSMGGRPDFVGVQRGGFGNPFDVTTVSGMPLAADFATCIGRGLRQAGYEVTTVRVMDRARPEYAIGQLAKTGAKRLLVVQIDTWKSDTYNSTQLFYGVTMQVFSPDGTLLGRADTSGRDLVGRDFFDPAGFAEQELPRIYAMKLELLLNNRSIARALSAPPPPSPAAAFVVPAPVGEPPPDS